MYRFAGRFRKCLCCNAHATGVKFVSGHDVRKVDKSACFMDILASADTARIIDRGHLNSSALDLQHTPKLQPGVLRWSLVWVLQWP